MRRIVLKPGRDGPVRAGHPWIFSGAIASGLDGAEPGEPVAVHAAGGRFVAAGYANPRTPIAVRVLTLERRAGRRARSSRGALDEALALRRAMLPAGPHRVPRRERRGRPAARASSSIATATSSSASSSPPARRGSRRRSSTALADAARAARHLRAERGRRARRGGPPRRARRARRRGAAGAPRDRGGRRALPGRRACTGRRPGFFLDQRESRARVRALAAGRRVLNAFAYTGAFAIAAALGGATRGRVGRQLAPGARARRGGVGRERARPGGAVAFVVADVFELPARGARALRPDRARPAAVRAPPARPRPRAPRLQGRQPAGVPAPRAGRLAPHLRRARSISRARRSARSSRPRRRTRDAPRAWSPRPGIRPIIRSRSPIPRAST